MSRVSFEVEESIHHQLRVSAAKNGESIKEFILSRILPDIINTAEGESLRELMDRFEVMRKDFRLERGNTPWREIAHEGHKW